MSDEYLSQDLENQFESIFFQNGDYQSQGIPVHSINLITPIKVDEKSKEFLFSIFWYGEDHTVFRYNSEKECRLDRIKLLMQIEDFYSNRGLK